MIYNFLKSSLRNLLRNKSFSFINITGLAIGIAASMILAQYINTQFSYDEFHTDREQIFRLQDQVFTDGVLKEESILIPYSFTKKLEDELTNIAHVVRFDDINYLNNSFTSKSVNGIISHSEEGIYVASPSLFEVFNFDFVAGGVGNFVEPNKLIITQALAARYFSFQDPIGRKLTLSGNIGKQDYEIVGVLKDLPENTHFQFNALVSFASEKYFNGTGINRSMNTYLKLRENAVEEEVIAQINQVAEELRQSTDDKSNESIQYQLQPIDQIQLYFSQFDAFKAGGDITMVKILLVIAVVILLTAWFNYINLSTVQAIERSKEVGIRKVLGSGKKLILLQFITESAIINLIAALLAFTLIQVALPVLKHYLDFHVDFPSSSPFWLLVFSTMILGTLISAVYPASIMMGFSPLGILNKRISLSGSGNGLRKVLVVFQFAISVVLIASTITVYKQVKYMTTADLGINIQNMVVLKAPPGDLSQSNNNFFGAVDRFKAELERQEAITFMTTSSAVPSKPITWGTIASKKSSTDEEGKPVSLIAVGEDYDRAYELNLLVGRLLQASDDPWSSGDVIVNRELINQLGFSSPEEAIGQRLKVQMLNNDLIIRGVVESHHQQSLKQTYDPIIYMNSIWANYYTVKLNINDQLSRKEQLAGIDRGLDVIEKEWKEAFPKINMDYFFLDDAFDNQYKRDREFGMVFGLFAGLAIIIASLGLFGLSSFSMVQRTKEIGIRKVLGASDQHVIRLLTKEYFWLILIANLFAAPLAWYFLSDWLQNYHFNIQLGWWLIIIPLGIVLVIAIGTISTRVLRVANKNPVESLRYE